VIDVDGVNRYRADAARLHLMANEMSWAMAHHPGCGITADCVSQVVHYFVRLRQSAEA
jgi:hypothetical protein